MSREYCFLTPNGNSYSGEIRSFLLRDYHRRWRKAPEQNHVSSLRKKVSGSGSGEARSPPTITTAVSEHYQPLHKRTLALFESTHAPISDRPLTSPTCDTPLGVSGLDPYQTMALKVSTKENVFLLHCRWDSIHFGLLFTNDTSSSRQSPRVWQISTRKLLPSERHYVPISHTR